MQTNDYSNAVESCIKDDMKPFLMTLSQEQAEFKQTVLGEILMVRMKPSTDMLLRTLKRDKIAIIDDETILADKPAKMLGKIHQISSGTVIDDKKGRHLFDAYKAEFIRDKFFVKKIAVFYVFKSELELLKQVFPNWTASPEEFQIDPDKTFLGQFQSAREGTRLDSADALVFYNIQFSYLSYELARNRFQSKDRFKLAKLYFVFSDCRIERYIYDAV